MYGWPSRQRLGTINMSTYVGIPGGGKAMKKSLLIALTMLFVGMFSVTGMADEPETLAVTSGILLMMMVQCRFPDGMVMIKN